MIDSEGMLDRSLATLSDASSPREQVRRRIQRECRPEHAAKVFSRRQRLIATVLVLAGGALLYLTSLRQMQQVQHSQWVRLGLLAAGGWAITFATVLFAGLYPPPGRRASRRTRRILIALSGVGLFAYLASLATNFSPLSLQFTAGPLSDLARCGTSATLGGGVIALGMLSLWRRTDPFDPGVTGAVVGLLGGLAGTLALGEVCPNHDGWHLWFGHGLAVLVVTLMGLLVGRRWLAP